MMLELSWWTTGDTRESVRDICVVGKRCIESGMMDVVEGNIVVTEGKI